MTTKESTELVRAASAVLAQTLAAIADGDYSLADKVKLLSLYPTIAAGLAGLADVPLELQDLQPDEALALTDEIEQGLRKSGRFSRRETEVARRVLALVYHNVTEIAALLRLPPTALPA